MADAPNRLMPQSRPPARPEPPAPKPLHNELWSIRSLAQQHLGTLRLSTKPLVLEAHEARLLLGTLVSLITSGQPKIEDMKTAANTGLLKAMKATTDKLAAPEDE